MRLCRTQLLVVLLQAKIHLMVLADQVLMVPRMMGTLVALSLFLLIRRSQVTVKMVPMDQVTTTLIILMGLDQDQDKVPDQTTDQSQEVQ